MSESDSRTIAPQAVWLPIMIYTGLALVIFARLLAGAPGYERVFRDYNMALPSLTQMVLGVSAALREPLFVLVLLAALIANGVTLKLLGGWSRRDGQAWFWAGVILLLLSWLGIEWALNLPMYKLHEALRR